MTSDKPPPAPTEPQKVEVTADDDATLFRFGIRRSSDRRRKMSTTPTEPKRGESSIKFQVPTRRKASGVEKSPTSTTNQSQGREAIVYSPASSSFSMTSVSSNRGSTPCSDVFFGSGKIIILIFKTDFWLISNNCQKTFVKFFIFSKSTQGIEALLYITVL